MRLDGNRCRFNSGYHDAKFEWSTCGQPATIRHEAGMGSDWRGRHPDPVYVHGYNWGELFHHLKIDDGEKSDLAWSMSEFAETNHDYVYPKSDFSMPRSGDIRKQWVDGLAVVILVKSVRDGKVFVQCVDGGEVVSYDIYDFLRMKTIFIRNIGT